MKDLPLACSLTAEELPERRRRWQALAIEKRAEIPEGVRLTFRSEPGVEDEIRALAELERDCCKFAQFAVSRTRDEVVLDVTAAGDGVTAVREIFS